MPFTLTGLLCTGFMRGFFISSPPFWTSPALLATGLGYLPFLDSLTVVFGELLPCFAVTYRPLIAERYEPLDPPDLPFAIAITSSLAEPTSCRVAGQLQISNYLQINIML